MKLYQQRKDWSQTAVQCDRCRKISKRDKQPFEFQDYLSFSDVGGYASAHGDETKWSIDLCGPCTKEVLGGWIKTGDDSSCD